MLTVFSSMRFPLQTMSAHFLLADCLSSCAIASENGAFTFPATHNSFSLSIVFTQESILQKQPFDSASREITKSWFQNLPIHNAEIKLFHVLSWGIFPRFSFHHFKNISLHSITHKMKGKVFIIPLHAHRLMHQL